MERRNILIVDDEVAFTRLLKANLENTGRYKVAEEHEGARALERATKLRPDLILMDIVMPGTNGAALAACIRSDQVLHDTPLVFLTATVPKEKCTARRELGGFPYVAKPVGLQEVIDCIEANLTKPPRG